MDNTIKLLNKKAEAIKLFIDGKLSKMLKIPILIDDKTVRVLAILQIIRGDDYEIWLDGNQVNRRNLHLEINLVYQHEVSKILPDKQETQEDV